MSVRKNVSFKNGRVLKAINELPEGEKSDFIERCVLYYLDSIEKEYITREEVSELVEDYERKVSILNENYTQVASTLGRIVNEVFKKKS